MFVRSGFEAGGADDVVERPWGLLRRSAVADVEHQKELFCFFPEGPGLDELRPPGVLGEGGVRADDAIDLGADGVGVRGEEVVDVHDEMVAMLRRRAVGRPIGDGDGGHVP